MNMFKLLQYCICLLLTGAVLQFFCGEVDNSCLAYPWSAVIFLNFSGILVFLFFRCENHKFFRSLFSENAGIAVLVTLLILVLAMGVTGKNISHSWPFVLLMLWLVAMTGVVAIRDWHNFRQVSKSALLFHVSLFLVLSAAIFGNADKQQITVRASLGNEIAEGFDKKENIVHLPFSIQLEAFHFEEYAPKLCFLTDSDGVNEELAFVADNKGKVFDCSGWTFSVSRYYDEAIPLDNLQNFQEMHHVGAAHVAFVEASKGDVHVDGWVCAESFLLKPINLQLDEKHFIAFKPASPKGYESELLLRDMKGDKESCSTSVNHPAVFGNWLIYQKGYDVQKGKWSDYSILECVHDGWSWMTRVALWLMVLATAVAIVEARKKSRKK